MPELKGRGFDLLHEMGNPEGSPKVVCSGRHSVSGAEKNYLDIYLTDAYTVGECNSLIFSWRTEVPLTTCLYCDIWSPANESSRPSSL